MVLSKIPIRANVLSMILEDFLLTHRSVPSLEEIQQTTELFSNLQEILDNIHETGLFILTGSNNFLLQKSIGQSLAGRIGMFHLMPFHFGEIQKEISVNDVNRWMLQGLYPPVHIQPVDAREWRRNYLTTYVERDVRMIKNITNLEEFERLVRVITSRNAQELNLNAIGIETGLDAKTVQSWIGILESSFIIFLLRPFHSNYKNLSSNARNFTSWIRDWLVHFWAFTSKISCRASLAGRLV